MVELDLSANEQLFEDVMELCEIPLNEEQRTGFKLKIHEENLSQFGFKQDLYIIPFNCVLFKRYLKGVEDENTVSSIVRRFVSMFMEEYNPNTTLLDVIMDNHQQLLLLGILMQAKNKKKTTI